MKSYFTCGVQINKKSFIQLTILYFSVYSYYYIIQMAAQVEYSLADSTIVLIVFNFSAAASLPLCVLLFRNIRRIPVLFGWALVSDALLFLLLSTKNSFASYVLSSIIGISLGFAAWLFSTHFITVTLIKERGRIGGLITAITLLITPIFISLVHIHYAVCVTPSLFILLTLFLGIEKQDASRLENKRLPLLGKNWRGFLLYLLPWIILCVNNATFIHRVDTLLTAQFYEARAYTAVLRYISAGLGALFFGLLSDWVGRKPLIVGEFIVLGIAGCISGILPNITFFLFFNLVAGFGWSFLLVSFLLIVWGEVPPKERSEFYFSAGLSVFYFSKGVEPLFEPLILISLREAALANACLMFIGVILLVSAKNLLPSELKEQMQFKLYLEQVKKRVRKTIS